MFILAVERKRKKFFEVCFHIFVSVKFCNIFKMRFCGQEICKEIDELFDQHRIALHISSLSLFSGSPVRGQRIPELPFDRQQLSQLQQQQRQRQQPRQLWQLWLLRLVNGRQWGGSQPVCRPVRPPAPAAAQHRWLMWQLRLLRPPRLRISGRESRSWHWFEVFTCFRFNMLIFSYFKWATVNSCLLFRFLKFRFASSEAKFCWTPYARTTLSNIFFKIFHAKPKKL